MSIYSSSKILLTNSKNLLIWLRDDDFSINDANKWDLPGRDIQSNMTPEKSIEVDLKERFNIVLEHEPKLLGKISSHSNIEHFLFIYSAKDCEIQNLQMNKWGQKSKFHNIRELGEIDLTPPIKAYFSMYGEYLTKCLISNIEFKKIDKIKLGLK